MALIDDCVAYYKCDDNAASTAVVDSTSNINGVSQNNTSTMHDASGVVTSCFSFNGSTDYITINNLTSNTTLSASFWIKYANGVKGSYLEINNNAGSGGISVQNQNLLGEIYLLNHLVAWSSAGSDLGDGDWHHLVLTKNTDVYTLYVDGSSTPDISFTSVGGLDGDDFTIGRDSETGVCDGEMCEVGIWERIITTTEIAELYNSGSGLTYPFTGVTPEAAPIKIFDVRFG